MIVFTRKRIFTLFFLGFQYFIFPSVETRAQIPTGQDCLGAAPVCQPTYTTASSTPGTGNYPNEQGPGTCLDPGEYNSSWFTFNISLAGTFAFTITPTIPNTDYDWALYNLSNASCADILTNGSLMVSCNSSQFGYTGISSTGVGNWNGPGFTNAFNYLINVNVGETYVLNINNWSGTNGGYSLDFGTSVASIFDTIKPKLDTIQPVICNENVLTFSFSEKVLCSSVQDDDFALTGPGGTYTLSNVTGSACSVGGNEESVFTCTITPSITIGGNYFLHLNNTASTVNDPCGNLADTISLPFYVSSVAAILDSVIQPTCGGNNGSIFLSASVGTPPYLFSLDGSPNQSTGVYTGLDSGTYSLIVIDSFACSDTIEVTLFPATGAVSASISSFNNINCYNSCDGWINVNASGGIPPYTYSWSNGGSSATVSGLCVGNYIAIIADNYNCADTVSLTLTEPPEVHFDVLAFQNVICHGYEEGAIAMKVTGGTPPYTYVWTPYGGGDDTAIQLGAGIYTLIVYDIHQCSYDTSITISEPPKIEIIYSGDTTICDDSEAQLHMSAVGGIPPYNVSWDNGNSIDNPYIVSPETDEIYVAVAYDDSGCYSEPVEYKVEVQKKPLIELGSDTLLCYGEVLYKNIFFPGAEYLWQDGSVYSDYSIREPGVYIVDAYNSCFHSKDTIVVKFDDCGTCMHMPNAFTPNGDGLNDILVPAIGCTFSRYYFRVFNRWGELVFATVDPILGWNGFTANKPSLMGTYVWLLDYEGQQHDFLLTEQLKGNVILIR